MPAKRSYKRPVHLTPQLIDTICASIATGATDAETERKLGLSRGAIGKWKAKGDITPGSRYEAFATQHHSAWTAAHLVELAKARKTSVRALLLPPNVSETAAAYLRDLM